MTSHVSTKICLPPPVMLLAGHCRCFLGPRHARSTSPHGVYEQLIKRKTENADCTKKICCNDVLFVRVDRGTFQAIECSVTRKVGRNVEGELFHDIFLVCQRQYILFCKAVAGNQGRSQGIAGFLLTERGNSLVDNVQQDHHPKQA